MPSDWWLLREPWLFEEPGPEDITQWVKLVGAGSSKSHGSNIHGNTPSEAIVEGDGNADMFCNFCKEPFEKRGNLNRHIRTLHTEKEGGWPCEKKSYCSEKFATKHEMYVHKDLCTFRCPRCGWSTQRSDRVEGHRRKCD